MNTTSTTIPRETARHVLWFFGQDGGYQPGSFTEHLLYALSFADMVNTAKIAEVYPDYAAAMVAAKLDPDGIANLQRIAGAEAPLGCKCGDSAGPFDLQGRCETCTESAA
ncbi:hypothetical protein ABZ791_30415 [Streptomyces huasconensis]|uniref:Uncharacterized protein n=1 Tax=Streptomyces huasconensis TaxID=1854574 RepID=A0ABV3M4T7_9ACTN